jgi:hypothetical protein
MQTTPPAATIAVTVEVPDSVDLGEKCAGWPAHV